MLIYRWLDEMCGSGRDMGMCRVMGGGMGLLAAGETWGPICGYIIGGWMYV